jgi:hypothetical protein
MFRGHDMGQVSDNMRHHPIAARDDIVHLIFVKS